MNLILWDVGDTQLNKCIFCLALSILSWIAWGLLFSIITMVGYEESNFNMIHFGMYISFFQAIFWTFLSRYYYRKSKGKDCLPTFVSISRSRTRSRNSFTFAFQQRGSLIIQSVKRAISKRKKLSFNLFSFLTRKFTDK